MDVATENVRTEDAAGAACDRQIRAALRIKLEAAHEADPSTLVMDELGLCKGISRVDMAVINGSMHGFEIKSERDTLYRLPSQQETYNRVFDQVTIVLGDQHLRKVLGLVPSWWGIEMVGARDEVVFFETVREGQSNPNVDASAVVQLLWRDEALEVLAELGLTRGMRTKPRAALWSKIVANTTLEEIRSIVRERLKRRKGWRRPSTDLS